MATLERRVPLYKEATTKNTKNTKKCFRGNSSRGYALDRQVVLNPRKNRRAVGTIDESRRFFVFFVVASL